ncbi:DNA-binding transcriptional regulator, MarR family [Thermoactinomyces sp. DSM 45891]|uniref:MarR family winged helix-turn-helix transcriptional regulator n=1 Tax=Thermoactinomyces sp. DSM 45891 TaxID=1761907 RepID=UPI00090EF3E6|nr:MarR family transcriptional regulator [Thermoactinomyces sp. DSM 45891]SFX64204.1 DNA-binding transcriptional regulator, MarR family [Thermoactinomyces sp. DSM 45891]
MNDLDLMSLLSTSFHTLVDKLHERLTELGFHDIRPVHGYIFKYIALHEGATGIELADHLGITKQAVSKIVDYLEENDYVLRKPHPTDKRGKIIVLTERGQLAIETKEKILNEIEQHLIENLGAKRMQMMKDDLENVIRKT